jgi:creatinine amidohydrolase
MPLHELGDMTWEELDGVDRDRALAILPVGATEAHGPHLPLATDVIIARAMATAGGERLVAAGHEVLILPPVSYSVADFAAGFAGTLSISAGTATALLVDVGRALASHGIRRLVLANAHLDPTHIASLRDAVERIEAETDVRVIFPDVTRKPWALRLTDEFKSGACHAGRYEGSIVLAARPETVDTDAMRDLPDNDHSLSVAIREGKSSFEEAGGPRAYFGQPSRASAEEGRETIDVLGAIVADAVAEALGGAPAG